MCARRPHTRQNCSVWLAWSNTVQHGEPVPAHSRTIQGKESRKIHLCPLHTRHQQNRLYGVLIPDSKEWPAGLRGNLTLPDSTSTRFVPCPQESSCIISHIYIQIYIFSLFFFFCLGMHNSLFLADLLVRYGDVHCELFKQFLQHNFPKSPQYANSKKVAINLRHTLEILEGASRYQPQKQKESNNDSRDDSSPQAKVSEEFGWRRDQRVVDDTADNSSGCRDTRPMTEDDHSSEWRRDHRMVDDTADNSSGWRRDHQMTDDTTASSEWRDIRCMFTDYGTVDNSSDWRRDQRSHHEVHMQPNRQEHQQREHETRWRTDRDDRAQHWQSDRHSSRSNHSDRHERWK